jgi:hypothetical protein
MTQQTDEKLQVPTTALVRPLADKLLEATARVKPRPVTSSNLKALAYDAPTFLLFVTFTSGDLYVYENVPQATFDSLLAAESVGQAFYKLVRKPNYAWVKITQGRRLADLLVDGTPAEVEHPVLGRCSWGDHYDKGYQLIYADEQVRATMGQIPADVNTLLSADWRPVNPPAPKPAV